MADDRNGDSGPGTADRDDFGAREISMPLGVLVQRRPGLTRWAKWVWQATAVVPGARPADWAMVRTQGEVTEYHAATVPLTLHRTETDAYLEALNATPPTVWVVLRPNEDETVEAPFTVHSVTASAYEAQDYMDSGEEQVERLAMPPALVAWVRMFIERHHVQETFKKRKRRNWVEDRKDDGVGDARVRQDFDVYRSPAALKKATRGSETRH